MSRLRVVILGTSFGRTVQAAGFQRHPGFELAGIAGSDDARARAVAAELGIAHGSGDWRGLIASLAPDVVSIATPVDLHHPMACASLEHGAHVLCEKPTALHRGQAAEIRDRARARGRVAAINHEFRFLPARRLALAEVRRGTIGRPRRGEILGRYTLWHAPASRGMTWLANASRGGGILGALGSHHTDCLRTFFGEPRAVSAAVRVQQPRRGPVEPGGAAGIATADGACTVHYEFDDGVTALVDLDATAPYRWERYEIHGDEGTLRWEDGSERLWHVAAGREPRELAMPPEFALERREGDPILLAPFGVLLERLHAAIRDGVPMSPDFDDAVAVQSALDAARASSAAGARVRVVIPPPAAPAHA
jgi:predicted dehydrogenase